MSNIVLCGLPKSGKTTIGAKLASKLKCRFIDTDHLIENYFNLSYGKKFCCREIYESLGNETFRKIEAMQIASLQPSNKNIISIGGGALEGCDNAEILRSIAHIVYLKVCPNIVWQRIQDERLPAFLDSIQPRESFFTIAAKRIPAYEKFSHSTIEANHLTAEDIIEIILNLESVLSW